MTKAKRKKSTQRRRPAARRRRTARRRSTIEVAVASLAHEIRTPLTGILAFAELLNASDLPERERRWTDGIREAADHLARLTTFVVDAVKADAAGLTLRDEGFSPRELAESVAGLLTARAESKGLDVAIDIAGDLPPRVVGDVVRLRGALENLIDNAVKFTERGRVAFAVSSTRGGRGRVRVNFVVTDSGIGITSAELKRLFRPFSQANAEVARRYGGTGLGLVFVMRTAEAMGGGLKVSSTPGRGSTFRLSVVVKDEPRADRAGNSAAAPVPGLRVLCAEDNPYGRVVLGTVLRELGHSVSFIGRGEMAVETVARNEHDVVLMDVALAGTDGIEATRRIRTLPIPAGIIPIIGVSGRTDTGDEEAAREAGMNAYLRKPVSPAELHAVLQNVARAGRA